MSGVPLLTIQELCAGYGSSNILKNISFELCPGEILCIVGESGCGKSTLLKAIMGSDPGLRISSGRIILDGEDLTAHSDNRHLKLASQITGMVFQNPGAAFNPIRSFRKQFRETLISHGLYKKDRFSKQVEQAFSKLGLSDSARILDSCPYEVSGGMNQRILLALILMLEQKLLLADEPTSALDATVQLQVAEEFLKIRQQNAVAQIIVTHNIALARFLGDRIGVMYGGELVELAEAESVLENPQHPYTKALLAAVPSLDGKMPESIKWSPE